MYCTVYVTYCNTFICHLKKSKDIRFLGNEPGNELSTLKLTWPLCFNLHTIGRFTRGRVVKRQFNLVRGYFVWVRNSYFLFCLEKKYIKNLYIVNKNGKRRWLTNPQVLLSINHYCPSLLLLLLTITFTTTTTTSPCTAMARPSSSATPPPLVTTCTCSTPRLRPPHPHPRPCPACWEVAGGRIMTAAGWMAGVMWRRAYSTAASWR